MPTATAKPNTTNEQSLHPDQRGEVLAEKFTLDSLSPADRQAAEKLSRAISVLMLKGLLNRADAVRFPVSADPDQPDNQAAAIARSMSATSFAHIKPKLMMATQEPQRLQRWLGDLHDVDFKRATIDARITAILPRNAQTAAAANPAPVVLHSGTHFNRVHLILRALHCVDETNPKSGTDDMVLGGVVIGVSGNVRAFKALPCGEFNDGTYRSFGEIPLWSYNINLVSGYPRHVFAIFKLVESDSDDREVAEDLTSLLSFLANTILSAVVSVVVGQVAGAVIGAIGGFISNLMDEDEFPPYGIRLTMTDSDPFNGKLSKNVHTENITAHGGAYRIGLKWLLSA